VSPALEHRVRWALEHYAMAKPADLARVIRELAESERAARVALATAARVKSLEGQLSKAAK
jgi:predicted DNA-binding ribbon-helix-helix protein